MESAKLNPCLGQATPGSARVALCFKDGLKTSAGGRKSALNKRGSWLRQTSISVSFPFSPASPPASKIQLRTSASECLPPFFLIRFPSPAAISSSLLLLLDHTDIRLHIPPSNYCIFDPMFSKMLTEKFSLLTVFHSSLPILSSVCRNQASISSLHWNGPC